MSGSARTTVAGTGPVPGRPGAADPPAGEVGGSRLMRDLVARRPVIIRWLIAIGLFTLLVSPMLPLLYQSFIDRPLYDADPVFTIHNFTHLYSDPQFHAVLWNTLVFSVVGTLISTSVGFIAALTLERLELPFRRTLKVLFLSPIFLSALILAFAWSMLYGPAATQPSSSRPSSASCCPTSTRSAA